MKFTDFSTYIKNKLGPSTKRKIICFSVDDYGVQRTASLAAREAMQQAGLDMMSNRFDRLDSLETAEDLYALYETLDSVKDINGRPAIFTAFSCPANIDFDSMRENGGSEYKMILLPDMYERCGYGNVMAAWKDGISRQCICAQYHGREHVNIKTLLTLLAKGDYQATIATENNSWSGITHRISPDITYVSAAQFDTVEELPIIADILSEGTDLFEQVWGYRAEHFTAPGNREHSYVHPHLAEKGIKFLDTNFCFKEHQGGSVYKRRFHIPFSTNSYGQTFVIRNCVYEPMLSCPDGNWDDYLINSIGKMFKLGKPANISTHRVNFAGYISPENRDKHLSNLRNILARIVKIWPDVEFMSTVEMAKVMTGKLE